MALRDRARIKVFAAPFDPARGDIGPDTKPCFVVYVQNRGRRIVAIERIWYTRHSTGSVKHLFTDRFDHGTQFVPEGQSFTFELDFDPDDLDIVVVEAQDGRRWSGNYDRTAKPLRWNR
ncbi:MAG TPA: hypothetical protein VGA18_07500 [Rhodothermales bacterium]